MIRLSCLAVLLLLLFGSSGPARADDLAECTRGRDSDLQLSACDRVIGAPGSSLADRARAYRQRGSLLADSGRHEAALEDFSLAIELSGGDAQAYAQRGLARLVLKRYDEAVLDLAEAIRLEPGSSQHHIERGYAFLAAGRAKEAITDFDAAIALKPESAVAFNNRGLAWKAAGDMKQAIADFTEAIALNPIYALAYANRGYAREATGEKAKAIEDLKLALRIDPTLEGAIRALGRLGIENAKDAALAFIDEGRRIVEANCSPCHATGRTGQSPNPKAPPFRRLTSRYPMLDLREPISRGIAAPHDVMPRFAATDADVDRIAAYIHSLGQ
ncbi:MAG: tetratricopeptide repeat protein [Hyphomicrobiaceae bacterium]